MVRRFQSLSLEKQIFISFSGTAVLLLLITLCLTLTVDLQRQRQGIDAAISSAADYVSSLNKVVDMLEQGYPDPEAAWMLDALHRSYQDLDVIAVYDRDRLRFYHTSRRETGESLLAGEEEAILNGADPYITTGYGTFGTQHMAFHAIQDSEGRIIGFATVAIFTSAISQRSLALVLFYLAILAAALLAALLLSRGIVALLKDSLGGRRPDELLDVYRRQGEVLNAIEDGLIATDTQGTVVFANEQAKHLFPEQEETLEGRPLREIFPETCCEQVVRSGEPVHNRSIVVGEHQVLATEVPVTGGGRTQGVLNIFHDKTEMRRLSDELSGTKYMLDTLRFINHEFMNRLHIILGYLQTDRTREAIQFILNSSLVSSQSIRGVADCIRVPRLSALIIGKMLHAAEQGIQLSVSSDSSCREEDLLLSVEDMATVIGNLLENAIEELMRGETEVREIKLSLYCRPDCNLLLCEDTGRGVDPELLPRIWEKGVSSKGENRGLGLYMIRQLVQRYGGTVQLETEPGEGTCFTLTFTAQAKEESQCTGS